MKAASRSRGILMPGHVLRFAPPYVGLREAVAGGRLGRLVCQEFSRQRLSFVVVEERPDLLSGFEMAGGIPLVGDASSDEVLRQAGVERARGLVAVMSSDADNLYTTMSARLLNKKLFIVARVEDVKAEQKLRRAGANRVVSPYQIGGIRLAQAVLRPTVVDFIELARARGTTTAEAVVEAGVVRARPILLTAAAVVVGGAVMVGDPIFQGLGIAMISGAVVATLLTLVAIPLLYADLVGGSRAPDGASP